jgi:hypothetical protein
MRFTDVDRHRDGTVMAKSEVLEESPRTRGASLIDGRSNLKIVWAHLTLRWLGGENSMQLLQATSSRYEKHQESIGWVEGSGVPPSPPHKPSRRKSVGLSGF